MSDNKIKPVCWRREWNGDISDLNSYVHADSEDELDGDGVWEPLYDKAAIDEAVRKERERCTSLFEKEINKCMYPSCTENDDERCVRWLTGECPGP